MHTVLELSDERMAEMRSEISEKVNPRYASFCMQMLDRVGHFNVPTQVSGGIENIVVKRLKSIK